MQFYALDNGHPTLAAFAEKQKRYQCPECGNSVRVRGGPHRQIHFYHVQTTHLCRQHKKTLTHLEIQWLLQSFISQKEVVLEHRFPEIGRIADLYWAKEEIVFEIQCSPISLEEVKNRCHDYESLGITPIWILYDQRFNRRYCSAAEAFLRNRGCYFSDGKGFFYDQLDLYQGAKRVYQGPRLSVYLNAPQRDPMLHFQGDRTARGLVLQDIFPTTLHSKQKKSVFQHVKRIYKSFFHLLLENAK